VSQDLKAKQVLRTSKILFRMENPIRNPIAGTCDQSRRSALVRISERGGLRRLLLFSRDKSLNSLRSLDYGPQQNLPAKSKLVCTQTVLPSFELTQLGQTDSCEPRKRPQRPATKVSRFTHLRGRKDRDVVVICELHISGPLRSAPQRMIRARHEGVGSARGSLGCFVL
jgi:hypothetical protein